MNHQVAMLLGAGASKPAGLPTSLELPQTIYDAHAARLSGHLSQHDLDRIGFFEHFTTRHLAALGTVIAALRLSLVQAGASPYSDPDIETVADTLRTLGKRHTLDEAPFIASWHPFVELLDRLDDSALERQFGQIRLALQKAIEGVVEDHPLKDRPLEGFEGLLREIVVTAGATGTGLIFNQSFRHVLFEMKRLLWLSAERMTTVHYLDPLLAFVRTEHTLPVFSLNYDNVLELWGQSVHLRHPSLPSTPVARGFDDYYVGTLAFPKSSAIHLYKLHGSMDWEGIEYPQTAEYPWLTVKTVDPLHIDHSRTIPWLVFGKANKLSEKGAFLDLFIAFTRRLAEARKLVVIGYSFRDSHINEYVGRWLNDTVGAEIVIYNGASFREEHLHGTGFERPSINQRIRIESAGAEEGVAFVAGLAES